MNRIAPFLLIAALMSGCGPQKMSMEDVANEKKAIESVIANFWKAYESKDLAAMTKLWSATSDVMFFGTDSAEVIKSVVEWQSQLMNDWQLFETIKVGDRRNLSTLVDNHAELASTISEVPLDVKVGGEMTHLLGRFAMTMKKENGDWHIVQGMIAIATVGQSSAEMVENIKTMKK